jgi:hypothetical protein
METRDNCVLLIFIFYFFLVELTAVCIKVDIGGVWRCV